MAETLTLHLWVWFCVWVFFWTERSTRSQWIFILFSPALISLSFLSGLLMVFWAPWKLPFCFAVFKFLLQISRQAWVIDIRLPKLLYCKRKPSLKTEQFFIVTSATWACEDLHRLKRNHLGCASTFAMKSHAPFCGVMNLALALTADVLLYADSYIQWLVYLSDFFFTSQCWQDFFLRWCYCFYHSQIICVRDLSFFQCGVSGNEL